MHISMYGIYFYIVWLLTSRWTWLPLIFDRIRWSVTTTNDDDDENFFFQFICSSNNSYIINFKSIIIKEFSRRKVDFFLKWDLVFFVYNPTTYYRFATAGAARHRSATLHRSSADERADAAHGRGASRSPTVDQPSGYHRHFRLEIWILIDPIAGPNDERSSTRRGAIT